MVSGYYIPYVVISGLVLDNDHFKNVELTNAKLINDGNRTIVAGLLLPGMQENLGLNNSDYEIPSYLEISADVTDFTLSMSVSIVTNEVFEDLDFSGLDSIDQLSSELNKLNSAMDQLVGGSSDLVKGIEELYKKAGTLPSGVATLAAGASQLASGASAIDYGVSELQSGIENLYGQINSNFVANNQNLQGAALLTFSSLIKNSHDLLKLKIQLATNETIANMLIPEEFTIDNYDEKLTALSENAMLAAYKTEILTAKASLDQYRDGFLAGINNYTNGVAYVNESVIKGKVLGGINDAENGLKAGTTALVNGAKSLSLGINQLNQSAPALVNGIEQLLDGSTKLSNGLKQFSEEGINKLVSIYNNNVRSLINKIQDIQNVAKNNSSKIKYIYRTDEIK